MTCLAPGCVTCTADALGASHRLADVLCVDHLLAAITPRAPTTPRPATPDMRGRCWGDALTCPTPAVTATPHGGWCPVHRPGMPAARLRAVDTTRAPIPDPDLIAAAAALVAILDARPIRSSRIYGTATAWGCAWKAPTKAEEAKRLAPGYRPQPHPNDPGRAVAWADDGRPPQRLPARSYPRTTPHTARPIAPTGAPTPVRSMHAAALAGGWSTALSANEASILLRARRGIAAVSVSWAMTEGRAKFDGAWLSTDGAWPRRIGAREATAILKVTR